MCPIVVLRAIKLLMLLRRERDCHSVIVVSVPWTRRTVPVYTYTGGGGGAPSRVISQGIVTHQTESMLYATTG